MLWEVTIAPKEGSDPETGRVREEYNLLTHSELGGNLIVGNAYGYLLEGDLSTEQVERLSTELLVDPLTQNSALQRLADPQCGMPDAECGAEARADSAFCVPQSALPITVLLKPGVMDPVAESVTDAAHDLGIPVESVRTFRRYFLAPETDRSRPATHHSQLLKVLANDAIEQVVAGPLSLNHLALGTQYAFHLVRVPLRELDDGGLQKLSRDGQLSLNLAEMKAIQNHFGSAGRDPTDVELEMIAQTWSEHCSHKTLKGKIDFNGQRMDNLLKETIFGATQEIRRRLGADDWCISVFEDNAGVVRFNENYHVCFKVETHNHPSAIEPYGGANTGLGGVIRDPLGTGLGAKPICNTDVFCFALPDTSPEALPPGVLHPRKVMKGVVAGVRDYGNRMGIPTVNGAVCFDERYLANPLVFCGTVGLIPVERARKEPRSGDLIVVVGGRTGRDGIHGATFSSIELTAESDKVSGGAVQIGNAITEKKLLDVIVQARDRGLYHAITDCGAGGFSSAVGEMGEHLGAIVHLDKAPLKYAGLSYTEIWISESQERMVLAVTPDNWPILKALCDSEDVEATVIGSFESTGRLRLLYQNQQVADLDMMFLHDGRPEVVRRATWTSQGTGDRGQGSRVRSQESQGRSVHHSPLTTPQQDFNATLLKILSSLNVCSKEWIIRQYDHEVQGGSVIKPLVGIHNDGPSDAAVIFPLDSALSTQHSALSTQHSALSTQHSALAIGCGINPRYGELDPYWMAAAAVDEAVRNVVAVGADPARIALLDNFCWGNTDRPEVLGSLVRAAQACHDVAIAYNMPFISGKDSLNNEYHSGDRHIVIPPTLLISALGQVQDVRRCVTMEKASTLGGRAATTSLGEFRFNLGPHALYAGSHGIGVLRELDVPFRGGKPTASGGFAVARGAKHALPGGFLSLVTTGLFGLPAKLETARLLAGFGRIDPAPLARTSMSEWIAAHVRHPEVGQLVAALVRVATYSNDPERLSAAAAIGQVQPALSSGVLYLDGGWQTLVEGLRNAARKLGVRIVTAARATAAQREGSRWQVRVADGSAVDATSVVIAAGPGEAAALLEGSAQATVRRWADDAIPVKAACLDLALSRLPQPRATFALGIDQPLYLSVHSAVAKLGPGGNAVIHVAKYLGRAESNPKTDERELEALLDLIQPGWRPLVLQRRFLPDMLVTHALPTAAIGGTAGRPGPAVPGSDDVYVVGDWVGPNGMLADASLASAKRVATLIAQRPGRSERAAA